MCIAALQWKKHPDYPLILVANRDEEYQRSASRLHWWKDETDILAGRDLKAMGTWLGMSKSGKIAALTNDTASASTVHGMPISRGNISRNFLSSNEPPLYYSVKLKEKRQSFLPYQFLFGDPEQLFLYRSATGHLQKLTPGSHALSSSNSSKKRHRAMSLLDHYLRDNDSVQCNELTELFHDSNASLRKQTTGSEKHPTEDKQTLFIEGEQFGTVSTAVILIDRTGHATFFERKYTKKGLFHDTSYEWDTAMSSLR